MTCAEIATFQQSNAMKPMERNADHGKCEMTMKIVTEPIPIDTYRSMRVKCGLSVKSVEAAEIGLKNSLFSVMILEDEEVIAMGRVIGDGGCFCQVVDICVVPEKQGKGIGKIVMNHIVDFVNTQLPDTCYTSLIADGDASFLYEKYGFRDTLPVSKGMYLANP